MFLNAILSLIFAGSVIIWAILPVNFNFDLFQETGSLESTVKLPQIETKIETKVSEVAPGDIISLGENENENESEEVSTAKSILVIDKETSEVLFEKNASEVLPIASLTKLMTALVFLETEPDWEKMVVMQDEDEVEEGAILKVEVGEQVKTRDLFYSMLIASDNNAAKALARSTNLESSVFIQRMNEMAEALGLVNTHFVDPTGLGPANVSTVNDLIRLASTAFANKKIHRAAIIRRHTIEVLAEELRIIEIRNTNDLLDSFLNEEDYQIIGGKTGYLDEAGFCLALEVTHDSHDIIVILLGAESEEVRWQEAKELVNRTFANY